VPKLLQEFLCQYLTESYNLGSIKIAQCVPRLFHNLFCVRICTGFVTGLPNLVTHCVFFVSFPFHIHTTPAPYTAVLSCGPTRTCSAQGLAWAPVCCNIAPVGVSMQNKPWGDLSIYSLILTQ
jgi:hypothetical protein